MRKFIKSQSACIILCYSTQSHMFWSQFLFHQHSKWEYASIAPGDQQHDIFYFTGQRKRCGSQFQLQATHSTAGAHTQPTVANTTTESETEWGPECPCRINTQGSWLALGICNTSTTKTWVAYGNSLTWHACKYKVHKAQPEVHWGCTSGGVYVPWLVFTCHPDITVMVDWA